jgi:predicted nucleic acid-binding protein
MERALILDTSFLIELEREHNRGTPGRAVALLDANAEASLYLPFVVPGALAAGVASNHRDQLDAFLAPFYLLPHTADVSWEFGRALRHLRTTGQPLGANDLWIAATALAYGMPLVTTHAERFRRVPHLDVESY